MKRLRYLLVILSQFCNGFISQRIKFSSSSLMMAVKFRNPYVETLQEYQRRTLWESNPFSTANSVIDTVLKSKNNSIYLEILDDDAITSSSSPSYPLSGYEDLFRPLYYEYSGTTTNDENVGNITGSGPSPCPKKTNSQEKYRTFKLRVAYRGSAFCGWQKQPNNYVQLSVQQTLEETLGLLHKSRTDIPVCGRTDAGVHAIGQVCRFRTKLPLTVDDIRNHCLKRLPNENIAVTNVIRVSRSFHPTFNANCRAYSYIVDMEKDFMKELDMNLLNSMLYSLEGNNLDYSGLSYKKIKTRTADCILYHARARIVQSTDGFVKTKALCIELVGNRFLRRMVRLLVGTVLDLVLHESSPDALLNHVQTKSKRSELKAPAEGLIFVDARFDTT